MPQSKKTKSIEESLWSCCDKLRGGVETQNYKHVVLSLIFLKFIGDTFEERRAELITEGNEKFIDVVDFYTMKNVFYLPEEARWSYIVKNSSKPNITSIIDSAMDIIEKNVISNLVDNDILVIAVGGGGIPVIKTDKIELLEDNLKNKQNLNLTYAVRDGIISHCGEIDENCLKPREEFIRNYLK